MAAAAAPAELELEAELEDESPEVVAKLPLLLKFKQGNLSKGIDKKTGRSEGIEPIKRVFTYVFLSVTHFLKQMETIHDQVKVDKLK